MALTTSTSLESWSRRTKQILFLCPHLFGLTIDLAGCGAARFPSFIAKRNIWRVNIYLLFNKLCPPLLKLQPTLIWQHSFTWSNRSEEMSSLLNPVVKVRGELNCERSSRNLMNHNCHPRRSLGWTNKLELTQNKSHQMQDATMSSRRRSSLLMMMMMIIYLWKDKFFFYSNSNNPSFAFRSFVLRKLLLLNWKEEKLVKKKTFHIIYCRSFGRPKRGVESF